MTKQKAKTQQINHISSTIEEYMMEFPPQYETDRESVLGYFRQMLEQLDTDVAIGVMERFGEQGKNQALVTKVNYGY
jgi:hypothetical protein